MFDMRRREFITLLGAMTASWPFLARAQQQMPVIGLLGGGAPESFTSALAGFSQGLQESGIVEGRNAAIEPRWARGEYGRLPGLAADLVAQGPAVIVTQTLPAALAAKAATTKIPIVFVIGEDPVEVGLVQTLNRPGGNVTGLSNFMNLLAAKRLEALSETVPVQTRSRSSSIRTIPMPIPIPRISRRRRRRSGAALRCSERRARPSLRPHSPP